MVFFQQSTYNNTPTLPVNRAKYQEEPDWAPAQPPIHRPERDASIERRDSMPPVPGVLRNDRESASYAAAVKAVNECMMGGGACSSNNNANSETNETVAALRGLWRVFDAGVGELGAELNDSLSNKAIFESCIYQETSERQGKPISQAEKNADAASRRSIYQSNLRSTLLRLRGSFADVLLGSIKEIQDSHAQKLSEMEAHYTAQINNMQEEVRNAVQNDIQKDLQHEIQNKLNTEIHKVKERADAEIVRVKAASEERLHSAQQEIGMLHRDIAKLKSENESKVHRLEYELSQSKQESEAELSRLHRDIEAIKHSRDDAVAKLSSTLETLQTTCVNAEMNERKLVESEEMFQQAFSVQRELRERVDLENERVTLLQNKLESETQSKLALIRVKTEIEKHLSLERERADLLQQELESQKNIVNLLNKEEDNWRAELEQAKLMNMQLREQLKNANEAGLLLNQKVDVIQPRLDQSMNALSRLSDRYSKLESELSDAQSDNVQLVQSLNELKGENAKLELLLGQVNEERDQLADALTSAQTGIEKLLGTVDKIKEENSEIAALFNEAKNDNTHLANALNGLGSEKTQLADILEEARSNQSRIVRELDSAKDQIEQRDRKISELNANYVACEEALDAAKDDVNKLSSMLKSYKEDLDKKSELNSLLDAEITRLEKRLEELTAEKSDIVESLNLCKDHLDKSSEVNSIMATKVAKLEATVEDQVLELQAAKLSEADVESSLAESVKANEELVKKLDGAKREVQMLTEKLRDECREKKAKVESLNEATLLLNDFERIIKELEERSKQKSDELAQMAQWNESIETERNSLVQRIREMEGTTLPSYEKSLHEKNELLNEMSEVVEALKEQILLAEGDAAERIKEMELVSLENAQAAEKEASERINLIELKSHELANELKNAMRHAKELEALNDCLETECDSLREKLSKCQEDYSTDRDKIAGALLGFDEEMTNAEAKIKSVLDELEVEKTKVNELSTALSHAEHRGEILESEMKNLQEKCSDLDMKCRQKQEELEALDKKQAHHEHELSVYQEAIKILQEKVDEAYGNEAKTQEDPSPNHDVEVEKLQKQLDDSLSAKNIIIEQNGEEIASLKEELAKEKGRLCRLQKLCFNAKQDMAKLKDQKNWLESSLKRSIDFIKRIKQSDCETMPKRSGGIGGFDQLCLPMDAPPDGRTDGKSQEELQDFFTYIENQVTCADGKDAQDQIIDASNSW